MDELELKRKEAAKKLADMKFIVSECNYLVDQLKELDNQAAEQLIIQIKIFIGKLD